MDPRRRVAMVLDEQSERQAARRWLEPRLLSTHVDRGRHMAADLAAARPDLVILDAVHASEAAFIVSWMRAQPYLKSLPLVILVPPGPKPRVDCPLVRFLAKPLRRAPLMAEVDGLLKRPSAGPDTPSSPKRP